MNSRLCKIELNVKDYSTKDKGSFSYHGEVVVIDENFAVRITNIINPQDRLQAL